MSFNLSSLDVGVLGVAIAAGAGAAYLDRNRRASTSSVVLGVSCAVDSFAFVSNWVGVLLEK